MTIIAIIAFFFAGLQSPNPDTLTLDYCYSRLESHYPISKKIELQNEITRLNKKIAHTAYYPQINLGAKVTYQSEVTEFQVPAGGGQSIGPDLSRDHYQVTLDVSQSIYNSGAVGIAKNLEEVKGEQESGNIQVQLHQLKEQVNRVYFGILLSQQQSAILNSVSESLKSQIESMKSKVKNGVLLPTQLYILEAELIKIKQDSINIDSNIKAGYDVLSQLIDQELSVDVSLEVPKTEAEVGDADRYKIAKLRPEFKLFESNRHYLEYQKELAQTNLVPSLSAFGTAAYGRPGFNVFENDLHDYYIVGLKLNWNLWSARNAGIKKEVLNLQKKSVNEEELAFERQLRASLNRIEEEIHSLENQIQRDKEILALRNKVVEVVASQLENGTATATEYVTELNKKTQAELSMRLHKTKLSQARIDYKTTLGIRDTNQ